MGAFSRLLNERSGIHVQQWRTCPDCRGTGEKHRALRDPTGHVPVKRVMVRLVCDTCKGKRKLLVNEYHRDGLKEFDRIYIR